ncbi:MAG: hypothetical protein IIB44_13680 [Candidatus Marinimicrobia bacterium]|nr:hypothetical protein [Candidatus Neomarinimicrobiota bacterium]MCH8069380.1 hypothetical protein [Candidatus Neomarinimicrobiota bacterium]
MFKHKHEIDELAHYAADCYDVEYEFPYGITVDSQTLKDQTVTVRERNSMEQERVSKDKLIS